MTSVVVGIQDQNVVSDLLSMLKEVDGFEVKAVADSTPMLLDMVNRTEPDIVFIDEDLGAEPSTQTIRDLSARWPAMAILLTSERRTSADIIRALESGARGVLARPFAFEEVSFRLLTSAEWVAHMKSIIRGATAQVMGRGQVLAIVGAKGGVGTTTVALHLAQHLVQTHPGKSVCLVDADVEKGDLGAILEVRQAVSLSDVAKVAADLSMTAVEDAIVEHESGIHLLLAPLDVRETEFVTAEALRAILAMLRRRYATVIVDAGGHVTPAQAAVLEIAEEALVVTTADVLAIRAMRRRMIAWEGLGVRQEAGFKMLVNRVDKAGIFPADAVARLTTAQVLEAQLPYAPRVVEVAVNDRDPRSITEGGWWKLMGKIAIECGIARDTPQARSRKRGQAAETEPVNDLPTPESNRHASPRSGAKGRRSMFGRGKRATPPNEQDLSASTEITLGESGPYARKEDPFASRESGAIAVETAGIIPIVLLACLVAWEIAVIGLSSIYSGHAATKAAREYAITHNTQRAQMVAQESLPGPFARSVRVRGDGPSIQVTVKVPGATPLGLPDEVTTSREVVREP